MLARTLLFVKHRWPAIWFLIDWVNGRLFRILHSRRLASHAAQVFSEFRLDGFEFRPLGSADLDALKGLLDSQGDERLRYFQPHGFNRSSLARMYHNPGFLMFGVFQGQSLIGYFFLRCFWNRKCFVGRLIDKGHEGLGIGRVMNQIMYHIAWRSGFRCLTTISRDNELIMRSHSNNPHARVVGPLSNGFILVEFVEAVKPGERIDLLNGRQ